MIIFLFPLSNHHHYTFSSELSSSLFSFVSCPLIHFLFSLQSVINISFLLSLFCLFHLYSFGVKSLLDFSLFSLPLPLLLSRIPSLVFFPFLFLTLIPLFLVHLSSMFLSLRNFCTFSFPIFLLSFFKCVSFPSFDELLLFILICLCFLFFISISSPYFCVSLRSLFLFFL